MRKMKKKNINLYTRYNKSLNEPLNVNRSERLYTLCAAGLVILIAGTYILLNIQLKNLQLEHDELSENIYSGEAKVRADEISRFSNENTLLNMISDRHKENIGSIEISDKLIDKLNYELINEILSCQKPDISIKKIIFEENTFSIICEALQAYQASEFVSLLDQKKLFLHLSYYGFNVEGDRYSFNVTAVL